VTGLCQGLADYLVMRRTLGFKLEHDGRYLAQFVAALHAQGQDTITIDNALAWVSSPPIGAGEATLANRMTMVRGFASYMHTLDPATQVPPAGLLPAGQHRAVPYLYSDADLVGLLAAARALPSRTAALTVPTLLGLLAVTGLRVGEALALDRGDLDLDQAVLTVRAGKHGTPRLVPLHPTTVATLVAYLNQRDQLCPNPSTYALFLSAAGTRKRYSCLRTTFARLLRRAGIQPRSARCRPRIHDLRHTLAVKTLVGWYRDGGDVVARLPLLSTFLGHVEPAYTYWYLHAAPELLAEAAHRLDPIRKAQP
jgi:integrase/recombinase XerD